MTFWSLYWWQWLAWLVGFSGVGSVITLIAWKLWNPKTLISNFAFSTWRMFLWNAVNVGKKVGFAFLFGLLGWGAHDLHAKRATDAQKAMYLEQWKNQYGAWQDLSAKTRQLNAKWQQDYATWLARQPKGK